VFNDMKTLYYTCATVPQHYCITSVNEVVLSLAFVCLLAGLWKNYSTDNSMER